MKIEIQLSSDVVEKIQDVISRNGIDRNIFLTIEDDGTVEVTEKMYWPRRGTRTGTGTERKKRWTSSGIR